MILLEVECYIDIINVQLEEKKTFLVREDADRKLFNYRIVTIPGWMLT